MAPFANMERFHKPMNAISVFNMVATLGVVIAIDVLGLATLTPHLDCCFELFGFDVIVDCTQKPWLLEINTPPALAIENPID